MRLIDADKIPWSYRQKLGLGIDYGLDEPDHYYTVVKDKVDAMPTVEAEPVRYTYLRRSRNYPGAYECSECGVSYPQYVKNNGLILNYCSKCGAKFLRGESV